MLIPITAPRNEFNPSLEGDLKARTLEIVIILERIGLLTFQKVINFSKLNPRQND